MTARVSGYATSDCRREISAGGRPSADKAATVMQATRAAGAGVARVIRRQRKAAPVWRRVQCLSRHGAKTCARRSVDNCATRMSKRRRHRHASSPRRRDLPLASCSVLSNGPKAGALSETDCATLKSAVDTLAFLTQELSAKGTTIERLRKMLFGASTEKTSQVIDDDRPPLVALRPQGWRVRTQEPRVTVARTSRSDRGMAAMVRRRTLVPPRSRCRTPVCTAAMPAPNARREGLLAFGSAVLVRIVGMAPLSATVYEAGAACAATCVARSSRPGPEGVGSEKYDENGSGDDRHGQVWSRLGPSIASNGLQAGMGVPLPAATQWEIVERAARPSQAGSNGELVNQGARGPSCT